MCNNNNKNNNNKATVAAAAVVMMMAVSSSTTPVLQTEALSTRSVQVVSELGASIWDGQCNQQSYREISKKCNSLIDSGKATREEKLGCYLFRMPGSVGQLPFGIYKTDTPLNKRLTSMSFNDVSEIFTDCALPQMIQKGCFTYDHDNNSGSYTSFKYASQSEYTSKNEEHNGVTTDNSIGWGPLSASVSYTQSTASVDGKNKKFQQAGAIVTVHNSVGVITNTCLAPGGSDTGYLNQYVKPEYITKWKNANSVFRREDGNFGKGYSGHDSLVKQNLDVLKGFGDDGFSIPYRFDYGVQFMYEMTFQYSESDSNSETTSSNALSAGVSAAWNGVTVGSKNDVTNGMTSKMTSDEMKNSLKVEYTTYGQGCDWTSMSTGSDTTGAVNALSSLQKCTSKMDSSAPSDFGAPLRVSEGGFITLKDFMEKKVSVIPGDGKVYPYMTERLNEWFATCKCNAKANIHKAQGWPVTANVYSPGTNFFSCTLPNGLPVSGIYTDKKQDNGNPIEKKHQFCNANQVCDTSTGTFYLKDLDSGAVNPCKAAEVKVIAGTTFTLDQ